MSEAGGSSCSDTKGIYSKGHKRLKTSSSNRNCDEMMLTSGMHTETLQKSPSSIPVVVGYTDPPVAKFLEELDSSGKYGIKEDMEAFYARTDQILGPLFAQFPALSRKFLEGEKKQSPPAPKFKSPQAECLALNNFIDLEDDCVDSKAPAASSPIVIIDSDDEQSEDQRPSYHVDKDVLTQPSYPVEEVILTKPNYSVQDVILAAPTHPVQDAILAHPSEQPSKKDFEERHHVEKKALVPEASVSVETKVNKNVGEYMGLEDDEISEGNDGLDDAMWMELSMWFEASKEVGVEPSTEERMSEGKEDSGCEHFFVLKDDIGLVCRICGLIDRRIDTIFEFQYNKGKRSTRTYVRESQNANNTDSTVSFSMDFKSTRYDLMATDFFAHPRHQKKMKRHQLDGFNFLCSNLMTDNPGGCILAHAPGAGKTFLTISFVQSFLARFPDARPLVVLPRGLLDTWKKEFKKWQVEDIPLHDLYTSKAENRSQQLDVLKRWVGQKSILFLGYQQFSTIICDTGDSKTSEQCREILLKSPSLLILDEGHTPRNDDTNQFQSLAKVQTPLKVVLSGTIYQNHVKEVFNLLNLVRPKFLKLDTSRDLVKRIMSRVQISGVRKLSKSGADGAFYDLVEDTLKNDEDLRRKEAVIQDLREMTRNVLHYYKGDFLDELPGLVEFTVLLNLSSRQKAEVEKVKKLEWINRNSVGSLVYMHPELKYLAQKYPSTDQRGCPVDNMKMDGALEKLNLREGVKAKFFLNMLGLCDSNGEKLLVFSQYLLPLKLMERLAVKEKGWRLDKEIFVVTGETNSKHKEWSMEQFNDSPDAKVFFGSIKACGEGISLVGASRVLIMDVQLNPSVTRQAIGRAFRPGQKKLVYVYRLVAADSPEVDDHLTCFKKEVISKVWFEWDERYGHQDCFGMKDVDVNECGDMFFESQLLKEDIKGLQKR